MDDDRIPFPEQAWPLLRKALEHIASHPEEFYMPTWVYRVHDQFDANILSCWTGLPAPECGTAACLAGHICLADGADPRRDAVHGSAALIRLGLLDPSGWPSSEAVHALRDVFEMTHIRTYEELAEELNARFTFPEPLPESSR